jgi:glycosyltransferase involved in cell wall biosynthesis
LVDPDDVEAIAQAMIRILTHTEPHPLLQNPTALRQAVIETYGFEAFTRTLADAIGSLQP